MKEKNLVNTLASSDLVRRLAEEIAPPIQSFLSRYHQKHSENGIEGWNELRLYFNVQRGKVFAIDNLTLKKKK